MSIKKKYNQTKDKKKLCPRCQSYVFNATIICTGLLEDDVKCNYVYRNKKICEEERKSINGKKLELDQIKKQLSKSKKEFKKLINRNKYIPIKNITPIKQTTPRKQNIPIKQNTPKKQSITIKQSTPKKQRQEKKNNNGYFITKKAFHKNINFIKQTDYIKKKIFDEEWIDDTFDNLKEIIKI